MKQFRLPLNKRTQRKPIHDPFATSRAIDREALAIMEREGCSFSDAWKALLDKREAADR